jgi:lipoprotein-releasing system ATP-binding protein
VVCAGLDVSRLAESELTVFRNSVVGLIFQFHYLLDDFTALENVFLPAYMAGANQADAAERARKLLEEVRLTHRESHYPIQLSGGERQRAAVARALVNDPELILADEPTGNLDEANSRAVEEILFALVREHRKTLILVTHDHVLAELGDVRLHLEGGELHRR